MKSKVLVFSKLFWPEGGGAELATYLIVRDILSKYFNVTVVSGTRRPKPDILEYARYIYWDILGARFKPIEWLKIFTNSNYMEKLIRNADIVYIPSHTLIPASIVAKRVNPKVKVVLHLHNYQLLTYTSVVLAGREPDITTDIMVEQNEHDNMLRTLLTGLGHYLNYINMFSLNYVDRVICVSRRQYEIITKYIPELKRKATVTYNPPPQLLFIEKNLKEKPSLLYPGGRSYVKGFNIALKSLLKILKRYECKAYVIYGREVKTSQKLLLEGASSKLGGKLILLGKLPYREYLKLHENVWGLLFPSISEEPLPYAIVESMLIGTIPIASRIGGIPEIIEGTPAENYLFKPGNINELIDKLELLLSQPRSYIENVGIKLREHALKTFNPKEVESKIVKILQSVLTSYNTK